MPLSALNGEMYARMELAIKLYPFHATNIACRYVYSTLCTLISVVVSVGATMLLVEPHKGRQFLFPLIASSLYLVCLSFHRTCGRLTPAILPVSSVPVTAVLPQMSRHYNHRSCRTGIRRPSSQGSRYASSQGTMAGASASQCRVQRVTFLVSR